MFSIYRNVIFSFKKCSNSQNHSLSDPHPRDSKFSHSLTPPLNTDGRPCQMWSDHPFNQRNKATKRAVRVEIGRGGGRGSGFAQYLKNELGNIGGGLHKIGGSVNYGITKLQVYSIYEISSLSKICGIVIKNWHAYKGKLFFVDFEIFTIVSDIVEHVLMTLIPFMKIYFSLLYFT